MVPKFPKFKKLELSDQSDIEKFCIQYQPYSDFEFTSLWPWDFNDEAEISNLHGNLVLILKNFRSEGSTYTFLGNNQLEDTLHKLFKFIEEEAGERGSLGLVPEDSIAGLDLNKYLIKIDFNACDYIYDLAALATFPGNTYHKKRKRLTTFLKNYNNISTKLIDINDFSMQRDLLMLIGQWAKNREVPDEDINLFLSKEYKAIYKFMKSDFKNIVCLGVRSGDKLIGFNVMSILPNEYAMGLFLKFDKSFIGINEYLMSKGAEVLLNRGCSFINGQEDLGFPGLRSSKNSYDPVFMLRKYTISKS